MYQGLREAKTGAAMRCSRLPFKKLTRYESEGFIMDKDTFAIYQIRGGDETRDFRFEPLERLKAAGLSVKRENYEHVYTGTLEPEAPAIKTLHALYLQFNTKHPEDFRGHSVSISDVVVLRREGTLAAYYVDEGSEFTEVHEFLDAPYLYYSAQRPVDIGTFPKFADEPVSVENFDGRKYVDGGAFQAWGVLTYTMPLTQKQIDDYELRAASGNPDNTRQAPAQLAAQLDVIGKWEKAKRIPDARRLTWFYSDFGEYIKNDFVSLAQVAALYKNITEAKTRAAQKPPRIAEQLAEAGKQVTRDEKPTGEKSSRKNEDRT